MIPCSIIVYILSIGIRFIGDEGRDHSFGEVDCKSEVIANGRGFSRELRRGRN